MNSVVECVRTVVSLLAHGEYSAVERLTSGQRLSAVDMQMAVTMYGRTLTILPDEALRTVDVVEVEGPLRRTWNVRVPLWTLEEGRSDLEVNLTMCEVLDGVYSVQIDDLHVP